MENKPRMKMSRADRAKQFAPFSALKGLDEALRAKERITVEKAELSEEYSEDISRTLNMTETGDTVRVIFYSEGEYVSAEGIVTRIDKNSGQLWVVKKAIDFEDIYRIESSFQFL